MPAVLFFRKKYARLGDWSFALAGAFTLALSALFSAPASAQVPADLQDLSEVSPGRPAPIDGIWRLQELNRKVMIESGHVIAMDEWVHALLWQVSRGMVTSTDLRQTGDGTYVAYDALLKRKMNWTLRADGTIEAAGEGGWFPPVFHLLPIELNYPEAFEQEVAFVIQGPDLTLPPAAPEQVGADLSDQGTAARPGPLDIDPDWTGRFHYSDTICLELNGPDDIIQGGKMQLWDCNDEVNQQFVFLEEDGLIVSGTGMCLEASGANDGAPVLSYGCDGNPQQVWEMIAHPSQRKKVNSGGPPQWIFRHANGLCLDAQGWSAQGNGAIIHLWECNSTPSQGWAVP